MSGKYTLQSHQCPKCGATLEVIPNQDVISCDYCNNTFSIAEKAAPTPPAAQPAAAPPKPKPNYDYQNVYVETQKQMLQSGKKTAKFGALFGVIMTVGMVGFGVFMAMRAQKEVKERQHEAQERVKNAQEAAKERQRADKQKRWLEFKAGNSEKITKAKLAKVAAIVKELNLPFKGDKNAPTVIYMVSRYGSTQMSRLNTFRKKMKAFDARFPKKFKWYFIPIPRDKRAKFREVDALFEAMHRQGPAMWCKMWRKHLRQSYYHFGIKEMAKFAKRLKLNVKDFQKALKINAHKEKIDKLESFGESMDLPDNDIAFIINNTFYNNYSALSRIDYVFENELGLKK